MAGFMTPETSYTRTELLWGLFIYSTLSNSRASFWTDVLIIVISTAVHNCLVLRSECFVTSVFEKWVFCVKCFLDKICLNDIFVSICQTFTVERQYGIILGK